MHHPIRLALALSLLAGLLSACSTNPYEENTDYSSTDSTYNTGNTSIPQASPLTGGGNTTAYQPPVQPQYQPTYQPPVQPQPPVNNYPAQPDYNNSYDTYAGNPSPSAGASGYDTSSSYDVSGGYDNSAPQGNDSYHSYGTGNTPPVNNNNSYNSYNDPYASSGSGGNNNYYSTPPANNYSGGSSGGGGAAVQVFASGSATKAEQIKSSMQSRGLNAVVDAVDGLYKVRIPFGSESEARANLSRVRSASGESGAFITFR